MTFAEFVTRYVATYVDVNSKGVGGQTKKHTLKKHLLPFFGSVDLKEIDTMLVEDFIALQTRTPSERMKGKLLSNKSINNHTALLGHILKRAFRNKLITDMPFIDRKPKDSKESPRLRMPDLEAILMADVPAQTKYLLSVLVFTGMRIGEVRALNWKNVHIDAGYINVCQSCPQHSLEILDRTKTGEDYQAPISPALKEILKTLHRPTGLVFESARSPGVPLRYDFCNAAITAACRIARVRRVTAHVFRHTNISMHVADAKNGAGLVRFFVGHSDIRMTQRYIGRDQNLDNGAMAAFEALFPDDTLLKLKTSMNTKT